MTTTTLPPGEVHAPSLQVPGTLNISLYFQWFKRDRILETKMRPKSRHQDEDYKIETVDQEVGRRLQFADVNKTSSQK